MVLCLLVVVPVMDTTGIIRFGLFSGIFRDDVEKYRFSPEYEQTFVRTYLEELRRLDGEEPPTDREIDQLYVMTQKYFLVCHI
jgi:hypothetical protein